MADHSPLFDHLPGWLAGIFTAVATFWAAIRSRRSTLADVEKTEAAAESARLGVFGQSFSTLRELLDYFEKRFEAVSTEAEKLRSEADRLREENRGLRDRAGALEHEVLVLRREVESLRNQFTCPLKPQPS